MVRSPDFSPMFANWRIDAFILHSQPLHRHSADNVRLDDLSHVLQLHAAVPYRLRINDHIRTVFALIQASSLVRPHGGLQTALRYSVFERLMEHRTAVGIAAAPRTPRLPLIGTYKDVVLKS